MSTFSEDVSVQPASRQGEDRANSMIPPHALLVTLSIGTQYGKLNLTIVLTRTSIANSEPWMKSSVQGFLRLSVFAEELEQHISKFNRESLVITAQKKIPNESTVIKSRDTSELWNIYLLINYALRCML